MNSTLKHCISRKMNDLYFAEKQSDSLLFYVFLFIIKDIFRVFTEEELIKLCQQNDIYLISDEIIQRMKKRKAQNFYTALSIIITQNEHSRERNQITKAANKAVYLFKRYSFDTKINGTNYPIYEVYPFIGSYSFWVEILKFTLYFNESAQRFTNWRLFSFNERKKRILQGRLREIRSNALTTDRYRGMLTIDSALYSAGENALKLLELNHMRKKEIRQRTGVATHEEPNSYEPIFIQPENPEPVLPEAAPINQETA